MERPAIALSPLGEAPTVSIAIYVKNARRTIARAIESALAQTWPHTEVAVIDGASSDGTVEIADAYRDRLALLVSEPDRGAFEAANKAVARTNGQIVCLLMADDWLEPDAAAAIVAAFQAAPQAGIVSSGARIVAERDRGEFVTRLERRGSENAFDLEHILGMPLSAARYWRREVLDALGGFDGRYPNAHDRDLLMRAWLAGVTGATTDACLYTYRQHPGSNTLGGNRDIVLAFLGEHETMAQQWLAHAADAAARQRIREWLSLQRAERLLLGLRLGRPQGIGPMLRDPRALGHVARHVGAAMCRLAS